MSYVPLSIAHRYYHIMEHTPSKFLIIWDIIFQCDDGSGGLTEKLIKAGDCFHFPPGVVNQEEAITDCVIIEGSTPHFNDRVRCESFYGLTDADGLPSTTLDEIVEK